MKKSKKIVALLTLSLMLLQTVTAFATDGDVWRVSSQEKVASSKELLISPAMKTLHKEAVLFPARFSYEKGGKLYKLTDLNDAFRKDKKNYLNNLESNYVGEAVPTGDLKVLSVSAINAKELEIMFSAPVDKATVVSGGGGLVGANVKIAALEDQSYDANNAKAKLSEDKRKLTVMPKTGEIWQKSYGIVLTNAIKSENGKACEAKSDVFEYSDKVAPTLVSVNQIDASTWEAVFSEPVNLAGSPFTFVDSEGTPKTVTAAQMDSADLSNRSIKLTIDATVDPGTQLTGTLLGLADYAGNLISPNPIENIKINKGNKDGVKPEIASIVALDDKTLEFKFSEEVQGFDETLVRAMTYAGTSIKAEADAAATVEQDKQDKTKYTVTLGTSRLSSGNQAIMTLTIPRAQYDLIKDLSGEVVKGSGADYTFGPIVVKKDVVKPKYVSHNVMNGKLTIEYDKKLKTDPLAFAAATAYKDYVTTSDVFATTAQTLSSDKKKVTVDLTAAGTTFGGPALVPGTHYTVEVKATGENAVDSDAMTIEFDYAQVTSTAKPKVASITQAQSKVTVRFDMNVDGATATQASNYQIEGLEIIGTPLFNGTTDVELEISESPLAGNRNVTVQNVRAKNGDVMDKVVKSVAFKETQRPTLKSAKITADDKILLTFSEEVSIAANKVKLSVDGVDRAVTNTAVSSGSEQATVVVTLTSKLTVDELDAAVKKVITFDGAASVLDAEGNPMDLSVEMEAK